MKVGQVLRWKSKRQQLASILNILVTGYFKYFGWVPENDGSINKNVTHRIQADQTKWIRISGVLCDRKTPLKVKGKFYRTIIRLVMLYRSECSSVKYPYEQKMRFGEIRMLRWMCEFPRLNKIRDECIQGRLEQLLLMIR